jgi:hypothetical protein
MCKIAGAYRIGIRTFRFKDEKNQVRKCGGGLAKGRNTHRAKELR